MQLMGRVARLLLAVLSVAPSVALAEYCWMLGCEYQIGYLPMRPAIFGNAQVKEGTNAVIANYAYLRRAAIEKPEGSLILGPGTLVKVLEVLKTREGVQFAIVRVVQDENTRREECRSTMTCTATFH